MCLGLNYLHNVFHGNCVDFFVYSPTDKIFQHAYRLSFAYINNVVEFKELCLGLDIVWIERYRHLHAYDYFELTIDLVKRKYTPSKKN